MILTNYGKYVYIWHNLVSKLFYLLFCVLTTHIYLYILNLRLLFFFRIHVWWTYQSLSLWKYRFLFCAIDRFLMGHTNNSMSYFTVATPCVISIISYWSGSIEQKVIPEFVFKWNWKIRADYILKCTYSHALWYHIGSGPFDKFLCETEDLVCFFVGV